MIIKITQNDIDEATALCASGRGQCLFCPIAISLGRHTGRTWWIDMHPASATSGFDEVVILPEEARRFILRCDRNKPVHPFSFQFDWEPSP